MTVEADLFTVLGPLVSNRVYPLNFVQPANGLPLWPAIRYTFISTVPNITQCGDSGEDAADFLIQLDLVDAGYKTVRALRLNVMSTMKASMPLAVLQGSGEEYDDTTKTFRQRLDYTLYKSTPAGSP